MIRLGLTGSIGMGKTTTAQMFRDAGIPVWDADATVHNLYAVGGAAVASVSEAFPEALVDGAIDRSRLKAALKNDSTALKTLEAIVHPLVSRAREDFIDQSQAPLIVLDIPLLFETGAFEVVDKIAVVSVPADVQHKRVMDRGTMDEAAFKMILSNQIPDAEKRARADYVIETLTMEGARAQVHAIISELMQHA